MAQIVSTSIEGAIATVVIDRPEALNALNETALRELQKAFSDLQNHPSVRVVILTGGGEKAFVAGADIGALVEMSLAEAARFGALGQSVFRQIELSPHVVIAAMNGYALGGGLELALACDIRVATEEAQMGLPEVGLGIFPGWGGTQRLPRMIGMGLAKRMIFSGERVPAAEALRIGLVDQVVNRQELRSTCWKLAERILGNGPWAVRQAKKVINAGQEMGLDQALALEAEGFLVAFAADDRKEGLTAFLAKRKPVWLNE